MSAAAAAASIMVCRGSHVHPETAAADRSSLTKTKIPTLHLRAKTQPGQNSFLTMVKQAKGLPGWVSLTLKLNLVGISFSYLYHVEEPY
jgi:hypothetical protein